VFLKFPFHSGEARDIKLLSRPNGPCLWSLLLSVWSTGCQASYARDTTVQNN
jgi:hypothetical protein